MPTKRRVPYDVLVADDDQDCSCRVSVLMVGRFGARVGSILFNTQIEPDGARFDILDARDVGLLQERHGESGLRFIVGDACDPSQANQMTNAARIAATGHDLNINLVVSPFMPEAVRADLATTRCCVIEAGPNSVQKAARTVLAPALAMLEHGVIGVCFEDLLRIFWERGIGRAVYREVSDPMSVEEVVSEAVAQIDSDILRSPAAQCFAHITLGQDGSLADVNEVVTFVGGLLGDDCEMSAACNIRDDLGGRIGVTLIAVESLGRI
jgi:hypothetical protein